MTTPFRINLASHMLPSVWEDGLKDSGFLKASHIFAFDCVQMEDGIELITRFEDKHIGLLKAFSFRVGGVPVNGEMTPTPRGSRLFFQGQRADTISIHAFGETLTLPVGPDQAQLFEGRNTLLTIAVEPTAVVLNDWLRFHHAEQGADSVLIFIRSGDRYDLSAVEASLQDLTADLDLETIVLVGCSVPLGHPEMPAEADRHMAPDAPGKALLPKPVPDPWRAPIAELAILEVARRRFLRNARAVLYCQPYDLVPTADETVFDAAHREGFIKFQGKRAYPFSLADDAPRRHGDHNCISFDGKRAENIWCAAPSKMEPGSFWRQFRVSNMEAGEGVGFTYWRCMAVRHPDLKVSELVPKSSLVESAGLAKLIKSHFSAEPKAPPKVDASKSKALKNDRVLIVTTMKNEGPFILEWLAYHRAIGVTDFLVYTNDCTDGTDTMFDLLDAKGIVEHAENPFRELDLKPQHAALQAAEATEVADNADWIICMDVDEYINIHIGDGTLKALFNAVPDATLISMTWRLFGNADVAAYQDRPIIEQFEISAPAVCRKPHQAWGFKTMFRNLGHYKKFGVHRPKGLKPEYLEQINWVNGSGARMPDKMLRTGWRSSTSTIGYDLVSLNHYSLRSAESFLVKRDRGRVNHVDRDQGLAYWFRMNHNAQRETSISDKLPRFRKELARLMDDPEIAAQHEACVTAHQTRIAELMAAPEYRDLYDEITGERLRTLSRMLHYFGNQVFLDGPDAVPSDFHLQNS